MYEYIIYKQKWYYHATNIEHDVCVWCMWQTLTLLITFKVLDLKL